MTFLFYRDYSILYNTVLPYLTYLKHPSFNIEKSTCFEGSLLTLLTGTTTGRSAMDLYRLVCQPWPRSGVIFLVGEEYSLDNHQNYKMNVSSFSSKTAFSLLLRVLILNSVILITSISGRHAKGRIQSNWCWGGNLKSQDRHIVQLKDIKPRYFASGLYMALFWCGFHWRFWT